MASHKRSKSGSKHSKASKKSKRTKRVKRSPSKKRKLSAYNLYMRSNLKKAGLKGKSRSSRAAIFRKVAKSWKKSRA